MEITAIGLSIFFKYPLIPHKMHVAEVAEVQGLYGPFTLSERVIQKVWLKQDFSLVDLKTVSGKKLVIKDPGRWNFNEGPDFKEAKLVLDSAEVVGDVEIHFNLSDWRHHRHEYDKNYDRVRLHVVLYPERTDSICQVKTSKGHAPEILYLLPLLEQDLESYAMEDALLELERQNEPDWLMHFTGLSMKDRLQVLKQKAKERWQQKLAYAKQRLHSDEWEHACHQYAMEVLGYKRNRAPMLRLAARYPLCQMRAGSFERRTLNVEHRTSDVGRRMVDLNRVEDFEDGILDADRLFDQEAACWKLNGLRPANHPRRRLAQYLDLVCRRPYWPDRLMDCLEIFPVGSTGSDTRMFRKQVELSKLRTRIGESVFDSVISEKRLNTLIVDAILPLATAADLLDGFDYWMHWLPGDSPDALLHLLRQAGVISRQNPHSNGFNQGALALLMQGGFQSGD